MMLVNHIDLNADLGEECGDDAAMLAVVSSANLACGAHAGGGAVLVETVALAAANGVDVGAHPSYRDRVDFGRVSLYSPEDAEGLREDLVHQVAHVARELAQHGRPLAYVKPHGALYHDAAQRIEVADLLLDALREVEDLARRESWPWSGLRILGLPGSLLERRASAQGIGFLREAYADRAYLPDGGLVPRKHPGAVLGHDDAVAQAIQIATEKLVTCIDGSLLQVEADSICLHGDTPGAVEMARQVRASLESAGVRIAAVARP